MYGHCYNRQKFFPWLGKDDPIGVPYLGRLVEESAKVDIFSSPKHPYTQMLLEAALSHGRVWPGR